MEKLEEGVWGSVRQKNEVESQGKGYKSVVRPATMNRDDTYEANMQEKKVDVTDMIML